ncbi:YjbH domain-containing protein [Ramlibacter sp.]|uniref:YjbH domain-containing protein n=1 Tax=Ramlibacter sp. TaxID=1917967 RepID=UPI003D10339F
MNGRAFLLAPVASAASLLFTLCAAAAEPGIATRGVTGGLTIPSADVLRSGDLAVSAGNFQELTLGVFSKRQNFSMGIGLLPGVEFFGRFAEYQNPVGGSTFVSGPRDLSANVKWQLPQFWRWQPDIAFGITDLAGGASLFKSAYAVTSGEVGPVAWTAGYARGRGNSRPFDGLFGGVEIGLGATGLSALAEYDGQHKHAGLRYRSPSISPLGGSHVIATLQRSFGGRDVAGRESDRTSVNVSVVVPLEESTQRPRTFKPERTLASLEAAPGGMVATTEDRLTSLRRALVGAGLERVRVGTRGPDLVVEYENQLFKQTEADALGIVLGLASEFAPRGTQRVQATTLKAGLPVYNISVAVAEYRSFLRTGDAAGSSGSLALDSGPSRDAAAVAWLDPAPSGRKWLHLELHPDVSQQFGTELAAFDYSIAADLRAYVPLWRGAELHASVVQRIAETDNYEPDAIFGPFRRRNGLRTVALQQSVWVGPRVLATAGIGRYNYDTFGAQFESTVFVPRGDDVLRLKAAVLERQPGQSRTQATPLSASYRWVHSDTTWVEAGWQQYTDGSSGPSIGLTRWFGEVGAHLFVRRGGSREFAGLELTIPLTPRRGADLGVATFNGASQFTQGKRTRIARGDVNVNLVAPSAVLDFPLAYSAEQRLLSGGRATQSYFVKRLHRMREAFYLYARESLPQ